ncbi:N-6 DNA methylase [Nonomuraea spiralis]|uniref:type I restriction-modification system subunit M n=1 Tax=Nonomuraea spiralis TaxID=46182 RepID=UPI003794674D
MSDTATQLTKLIWSVADLLRGEFKPSEYGRIVLPFTVLRRLDSLLAPTRQRVLDSLELRVEGAWARDASDADAKLRAASGYPFYNTSSLMLANVADSPHNAAHLLASYVDGFSRNVREIFEHFEFGPTIRRLENTGLLYKITNQFLSLDLGPTLSTNEMGLIFENVVRRSIEWTSESSGEHITPPDVGRLMAALLTETDLTRLATPGAAWTVHDPACRTGGLLGQMAEHIMGVNPEARVLLYGQELNAESWAIARSGMLMSGHDAEQLTLGDVLREDRFPEERFDYLLTHPPFGLSWKRAEEFVRNEHWNPHPPRFHAGLPRISDASLLFLQHLMAKMKPMDSHGHGGSRVAVVFSASPMYAGGAGSGESEIRRWIVKNDWLEGIVALPDQLFHNTAIGTYLWILSNRKSPDHRDRVILVKAQDEWQKMRRSMGGKRKYLGPDQVAKIVQLYGEALSGTPNRHMHEQVRVVRSEELQYRQIVVERPLRMRFELSQASLDRLAALRTIQRRKDPEAMLSALRELIGTTWATKSEAFAALRRAVQSAGQTWPEGSTFDKAVRNAIGMRDSEGELQRRGKAAEPDPELRDTVSLPLDEDPEDYLRIQVLPHIPDAWIDHDRTRLGCEVRPSLFYLAELDGSFEPLLNFARLETARVELARPQLGEERPVLPKHLTASHLRAVDSALELPDVSLDRSAGVSYTPCSGGDLVGRSGNWRLLPPGFGDAVTSLFVLHPLHGRGRALCEWLNSRKNNGTFPNANDLLDTPVPVDLVTDPEVDDLLEEVQEGRRTLQAATEDILPNVFASGETVSEDVRKAIRFSAHEARLVGQLVRPLDDPVWRAESSYPFHVAALSRRYRISTHPAERKDGLLKLGEGLARTLGVLALSELIARDGFTRSLRQQFRTGATFGTWLWLIERFRADVETPRLPELAALREHDLTRSLLEEIKNFRNHSHHAHGVRMTHELDEDVETLEPRVVSAIRSANWLSGIHWFWVERCEYHDDSSYRTVGLRLRGSHPSWEPFERSTTYPLRPDRIYVDSAPSGRPVDLWPLAMVSLCPDCRTREFFMLNQIRDGHVLLRSLEEHSLEIAYSASEET